jgi:ornithine cyclodeaminase/alanine dehydrogenase-like protein (mu-crystallin family)
MTLVLNDEDVAQVLKMEDCIQVLEDAYTDMGKGLTANAPRRDTFISCKDGYYSFKTIEGGLSRLGVMAQRVNSDMITYPVVHGVTRRVKAPVAPGNRYVGLIFLYSIDSLELLAIFTDGHLQRMRVAGTTGVGVKHFAKKDARIAALIGTGWQAEAAAWALSAARPLTEIRVYSPNREHRENFARIVSSRLNLDVVPMENAQKAVDGSDIVATATNASSSVFKGEWLEQGMHVTCITAAEFDEKVWEKSDLILFSSPPGGYSAYNLENLGVSMPSDEDKSRSEVRKYQLYQNKIFFLSDFLVGKTPGRLNGNQITMMNKGWGLGIEFAAVGKLVYDKARKMGLGKELPGDWFTQTSHP